MECRRAPVWDRLRWLLIPQSPARPRIAFFAAKAVPQNASMALNF
jgi:hypothetical protein